MAHVIESGAPGTSQWSTVNGTVSDDATVQVQNDATSYKCIAAATQPFVEHAVAASKTIAAFKAYFRVTSVAPSTRSVIVNFRGASSDTMDFRISTSGVLQASAAGSGIVDGPTLTANTTFGIEAEFDVSANPWVLRWRTWNGSTWTARTNCTSGLAASTVSHDRFGHFDGPTSAQTVNMEVDWVAEGTTAGEDYNVSAAAALPPTMISQGMRQAVARAASWFRRHDGLLVPVR